MKKILYLMSVVCLMMAASCDKNGVDGPETKEPSVTNLEGVQTAGARVAVMAENLTDDAKFSLKPATGDAISLESEIMSSGAEIELPYNLGTFTLCLEQDDKQYTIGDIEIAVTGLGSLPEAVEPYDEITIVGSGFASDAKISIGGSDIDITPYGTGVKVIVPSDMATGTKDVFVKQEGTEQKLGSLSVETQKVRRRGLTIKMSSSILGLEGDDMLDVYICNANYNAGKPVSFSSVDIMGSEYSYSISVSGNVYTFSNEDSKGPSWVFTIENGRVAGFKYGNEEYPWTYNADGQLTSFNVDGEYPFSNEYSDNGNYYGEEYLYGGEQVTKTDEIDFLVVLDRYNDFMTYEVNPDPLYAAMVFGWAGKPSKYFATEYQGMSVEYTEPNANGYVPNANIMGMFEVVCEYR